MFASITVISSRKTQFEKKKIFKLQLILNFSSRERSLISSFLHFLTFLRSASVISVKLMFFLHYP